MRRVSTPVCCSSSVMTGPNVWPSNGCPCSALACSTNWPPLGFVGRGGDRHFAAELIGRPSFAFADALDLGGMQRINLGTALAVILKAHPHRQGEKMGEALPQRLVVADLAADIADHPTEPNAQELEFSPRPIELVGMGIAADHDRGALGHPPIAL